MNILLFGSTGMLGKYVYEILKVEYNIICISRQDYDIENDDYIKLQTIIEKRLVNKNDIIINCAGIIPQKYKNDNYKTYIKVNSLFPHKLNELSIKNGYNFIHITTDCVFDGSKGNYSVNDIHSAKNIYGITKSLGEPHEATIIRSSIIGEELTGKKSLIEWVKSNKDGSLKGFTNHYWNGITCLTMANLIKDIIDKNQFWRGVKHIFSPNTVTKYELCCYINQVYNLNINIEKYEDSICKNMTLIGDYDLMYKIPTIYKQITELKLLNF
jgi:dTDP-4-dehydrorhamnose reductase